MKKLLLLLLLSFSLLGSAYATSHFHDWPDDSICMWVKQKPNNEGYLNEARKRGLDCNGMVTTKSPTDESDTSSTSSGVTNNLGYPDGELREPKSYSIFSSQSTYFKKLVNNGLYFSAQELFKKYQRSYFMKTSAFGNHPFTKLEDEFITAANGILATFEPSVQENIDALEAAIIEVKSLKKVPESKWSAYKKLLDNNTSLMRQYELHPIVTVLVSEHEIMLPLKRKASTRASRFRNLLEERAEASFKAYDFINKKNFFVEYPGVIKDLDVDATKKITFVFAAGDDGHHENPQTHSKISIINSSVPYILSELDKVSTEKFDEIIKLYRFDTLNSKLRPIVISKQFNEYDILNKEDFFTNYTLPNSAKFEVINESAKYILSQLDKASLEQATNLIKRYKLNNSSIEFSNQLSGILLEKSIDGKKDPSVIDVVNILKILTILNDDRLTAQGGAHPGGGAGAPEADASGTNGQKTGTTDAKVVLPAKYQIAVLNITSDYAKEPTIAPSKIFNSPTRDINKVVKSPYIITVQSRIESIHRSDDVVKKVQSQYKSSTSIVQNPEYSSAQSGAQSANNAYQRAVQQFNEHQKLRAGMERDCDQYYYVQDQNACMIAMELALLIAGNHKKSNELSNAVRGTKGTKDRADAKLARTPSQISQDDFTSYSFTTRTFEVTKNVERRLFLINNNSKTYSVLTVPHQEKKTFVFESGLDRNDETHRQNQYQNDDDIEIFVNKPDSFSIEQLIAMIPEEHQTKELEAPVEQVLQAIQYAFDEVTRKNSGQEGQSQDDSQSTQTEESETGDYIEKIKEAKSLLDAGIISEEEFEEIKKKIIDNI